MEKKVNQQQTLFTFVSIRPPELTSNENKDRRFVFHPDGEGDFVHAVNNRPSGQTKWEAMEAECDSFTPYASASELQSRFKDNADAAEWLARNKSNRTPQEIYDRVKGLSLLPDADVITLWDNLFYQVIRQDDFYVKETVIQLLVLQNLIAIIKKMTDQQEILDTITTLANATTVLPTELFSEDPEGEDTMMVALAEGETEPIFSVKKINSALEVATAKSDISRNAAAVKELVKMQKAYFSKYDDTYQAAYKKYETDVQKAYDNATIVEKERTLCPSDCIEKYYVYENLDLPTLTFTPPEEVSPSILKSGLSEESYYVVESLDLLDEKTYNAIIQGVDASTAELTRRLYTILPDESTVVTIGGMTFKAQAAGTRTDAFLSALQVPFSASFQQTNLSPVKGRVLVTLDMGYANADATSVLYTATMPDGSKNTNGSFTDTASSNMLNLTLFPDNTGVTLPANTTEFDISADITLSNGTKLNLGATLPVKGNVTGVATINSQVSTNDGRDHTAFVPEKFGLRRLGIADYKKVVSEVCCYREAEVSHIENVMAREFLSKTTTRERIEENTTTTENVQEAENITDTSTTQRFDMQSEVAKAIQEQKQFGAYAEVQGKYGDITFQTGANYATSTSKEESNRQAVTQSKEITERATERIMTRFRQEVVQKITERFKEENSHVFDNRAGENNVSGVYRFINAIYKNQIYNYGKRLMYEFMIPQPSKLYRFGMQVVTGNSNPNVGPQPVEPKKPTALGMNSPASLSKFNFTSIAAEYGADVEAPPSEYVTVGKSYSGQGQNGSHSQEFNDLKVPDGYRSFSATYNFSMRKSDNNNITVQVMVGDNVREVQKAGSSASGNSTSVSSSIYDMSGYESDTIPVSVVGWDLGAFSLNLSVKFRRKDETYDLWQLSAYETIMAAYQNRLNEYYDKLNTTQYDGETMVTANPLFYRQFEQITLKKNCLTYLLPDGAMGQSYYTGDSFTTFNITKNQAMDNYASQAKFMEEAFEWDIMSYNFYPYYWGNRDEWIQLYQSENDDPLFRSFMQAGMARVIVSVRPGFEDAVMHYMTTGNIWNGGEMPVIGDPLYLSIVDELKEQEYTIEETWETVVPTSLIALQKGGVAVDVEGLPCGGGCEDEDNPLVPNDSKLGPDESTGTTE